MTEDPVTEVILIGGRSGVGKTSVADEASLILARAGIRHAVIEGDALDHAHPEPWRLGLELAERNLAAMWANYRAAGYHRLIFTNTVSVLREAPLSAALDQPVRTFPVLLTATDATAESRIVRRENGSASAEHIDRSIAASRTLDAVDPAVPRIATDGRTVTAIAVDVLVQAGWLPDDPARER